MLESITLYGFKFLVYTKTPCMFSYNYGFSDFVLQFMQGCRLIKLLKYSVFRALHSCVLRNIMVSKLYSKCKNEI